MTARAATVTVVLVAAITGCVGELRTSAGQPIGAATASPPGPSTTILSDGPPSEAGGTRPVTTEPSASGSNLAASAPVASAEATLEPPPEASLQWARAEQPGVPGGYTWRGGTESAPWLSAGALEAVTVSAHRVEVSVGTPVERWVARVADVTDTTGAAASPLASGEGDISFPAPPSGQWVLAVEVVFASGTGDAAYYWEVAVP